MSMSRTLLATMALAAAIALPACGQSHTSVHVTDGGIQLHDGYVTVHAEHAPEATITGAGDLRVGSRKVAVNTDQRQLLRQYYTEAENIGRQGAAVGKAGASMAGGTVGDVFRNLFSGHPDRIDADVHKRTDRLLSKVSLICDGLHSLQITQDAIAGQLEAFRPYAHIHASDVQDCRNGVKDGRSENTHADN